MAETESGQEKTEDATAERKRKAKEEGQLVRSRELVSVGLVAAGAVGLFAFAPLAAQRVFVMARNLFSNSAQIALDPQHTLGLVANEATLTLAWSLLPFMLLVLAAGVVSQMLVGGWNFSTKALAPKLERLSFIKGLKRMFSMRSLVELFKSILKFFFISAVAFAVLYSSIDWLMSLVFFEHRIAIASGVDIIAWALLAYAIALGVVAAIDVPFQMADHAKQLKMTRQEVKEEMKNAEGSPEVKARIRRLQQDVANRRMLADVPEASVVLTNPEHYSVALKYDAGLDVPIVCAKGVDEMALRIREVAVANGVEVLPLPPLTRAIYHNSALGEEIPLELYAPVAQVLAYVARLNDYRSGRTRTVPTLGPVQVPDSMAHE